MNIYTDSTFSDGSGPWTCFDPEDEQSVKDMHDILDAFLKDVSKQRFSETSHLKLLFCPCTIHPEH